MIVGLITLVAGVVFLVISLNQAPAVQDGEYLVSVGEWTLDDGSNCTAETSCESGVIWNFTEIGKGKLTTDNHKNDYDFIWSLKDGKLLIETDWLYTLNNEYNYEIDQGAGTLVLNAGEETYKFSKVAKPATESD